MPNRALSQRIIYVDINAGGVADGISWETAYTCLQDALSQVESDLDFTEIWVAQGIYTPDNGGGFERGDQTASFRLKNRVTLKGGFAGVTHPEPTVRDPNTYKTCLSGDLSADDVWFDPARAPPYGSTTYSENSECIVNASYTDATAVLEGFAITGNNSLFYGVMAGRRALGDGFGLISKSGGIYIRSGSPTIKSCVFEHNLGAGLANTDTSHPTLFRSRFTNNYSVQGAAINTSMASISIHHCTFDNNFAIAGGAIANVGGRINITDSTFSANTALERGGGGIWNNGGEVYLRKCHCYGNEATWEGGVLYSWMSHLLPMPTIDLDDCRFHRNVSGRSGGALSCSEGELSIRNCDFAMNTAEAAGGGISLGRISDVFISNSSFRANTADLAVGAVHSGYSDLAFKNCLFVGNRTELNGTIGFVGEANTLKISRCTIAGNTPVRHGSYGLGHSTVKMSESIVRDSSLFPIHDNENVDIQFSNILDGWPGNNINVDPMFSDPGYWDPNGTADDPNDDIWIDGDYHLKSQAGRYDSASQTWIRDDVTSPCIDAGDPNSPIGLEPFPNGGRINMGAYGGTAEASKSYFGEPVCETVIAGDINGDCRVDFKDAAIMMNHWLQNGLD